MKTSSGRAIIWKMVVIEPRSVMEAKRWIGRIVFGPIGIEMAGLSVRVLVDSVNHQRIKACWPQQRFGG